MSSVTGPASNTGGLFCSVTHVIFDVDGLLLDTETLYTTMMRTIAAQYNKEFSWAVKVKQMGKKQAEAGQIFIDELGIDMTVDEYCHQLNAMMPLVFPQSQLMPGAERLVRHLYEHGIPMSLATGSRKDEFRLKTSSHVQLFSLFTHTVCSSDDPEVKHGKPAPDCFLVAAQRFSNPPSPERVLVFEDAPNGVAGALAAGMRVVWVPDPNCPAISGPDPSSIAVGGDALTNHNNSVLKLNSLEDFKPELFSLPPFS